jgi:hypothetical protein
MQIVPLTNPRTPTSRSRGARPSWRIPDFVKGVLIGTTILALVWMLL